MPIKKKRNTSTPLSEEKKNGNEIKDGTIKEVFDSLSKRKKGAGKGSQRIASPPKPTGTGRNKIFPPTKYQNKRWYVYDSKLGCYLQQEDNYICQLTQYQLGDVASAMIQDQVNRIRYASHYLGVFHPAVRFDKRDILVNALNGVVRLDRVGASQLENHHEKWCFNGVLPIPYNPNATCPVFDQELIDKLPDPLDQQLLLYFGAYCLIPDCRFGITLFNYGDTHTGKSTLIVHGLGAVFGDLLGFLKLSEICPENYSGISYIPTLADKLLNIGSEVSGREVKDTTNFKRLISGESIMAREAFDRGGRISTCCKLAFNMNELPKINGTTADVARIRLLFFDQPTEHGKRSYEIEKKIKLEGSGILNRLLEQMHAVLKLTELPYGSNNSMRIYDQLGEKIDPYTHFMDSYKDKLELGKDPEFEMSSDQLDPYIIEFLRVNNYDGIFHLDIFKRRLYPRFHIKSLGQQWRPLGIPRSQQRKVTLLHGIRKRVD